MDKVLMPRELTAENGAKALLIGEFYEEQESNVVNVVEFQKKILLMIVLIAVVMVLLPKRFLFRGQHQGYLRKSRKTFTNERRTNYAR